MKENDDDKYSNELINKIQKGLDLAYQRLLEEKKANNRELVVLKDNKIVMLKPEDMYF